MSLAVAAWTLSCLGTDGCFDSGAARGRPLTVAAAADLQFAFAEMGDYFRKSTRQETEFSFGSTGTLTRQIENGAPFDAFFAANEAFVDRLYPRDLPAPGTRRLYAIGRIVLASHRTAEVEPRSLRDLLDPRIRRIAIANPEHAP